MNEINALIIRNECVGPDLYEMELDATEIVDEIAPGHFLQFNVRKEGYHPLLMRPFSIFTVNKAHNSLLILYKVIGIGTRIMTRMKAGEKVTYLAPLGNTFTIDPDKKNIWIVTGGIGMAPFFYLVEKLPTPGRIFYGATTKDALVGLHHFRHYKWKMSVATDDGTIGHHGLITDLLPLKFDAENPPDMIYSCGPTPMMKTVVDFAKAHQLPCEVSVEEPMACGVGACYGCVVKKADGDGYFYACKHGPVFDAYNIVL